MTEDLASGLLESDEIVIPYEEFQGKKHVDTIIYRTGDYYTSLSLVDDDRNFGPADLVSSGIKSEDVFGRLQSPEVLRESLAVKEIQICRTHFIAKGHYGTGIIRIVFVGKDGRELYLSNGGSRYSYDLVLEES